MIKREGEGRKEERREKETLTFTKGRGRRMRECENEGAGERGVALRGMDVIVVSMSSKKGCCRGRCPHKLREGKREVLPLRDER